MTKYESTLYDPKTLGMILGKLVTLAYLVRKYRLKAKRYRFVELSNISYRVSRVRLN